MRKLVYVLEGLGVAGVLFALLSSITGQGCICCYLKGLDGKFVYEQHMLTKYREKIQMERELYIQEPSQDVKGGAGSKDQGYIEGVVLGEGTPLEDVMVWAYDTSWTYGYGTYTNSQGYYIITNLPDLPTELYKVEAEGATAGYVNLWWDNKLSFWSADTVRVNAGDTTSGIDFDLPLAAYISGTVTDEGKDGLQDVWVDVYDPNFNYVSSGVTDQSGFYTVGGMIEGFGYRVATWNWLGYVDEWYNDKPDFLHADPVDVVSGDTTENIDFGLALGSFISGTVTGPSKQPLENVMIEAVSTVNGGFQRSDMTDNLGQYTISGLPVSSGLLGGYRVHVAEWAGNQYAVEWYDGKSNLIDADIVDVTQPGDTVDGIDFELAEGGFIRGLMTGEDRIPLSFSIVIVFQGNGSYPTDFVAQPMADFNGEYEVLLAPGDYILRSFNTLGYIDEYYDNEASWDNAEFVTVNVAETTNVDFSLTMGGGITGTVYKANMEPFPQVGVAAVHASTGEIATVGATQVNGVYALRGLPTGWYKVCAFPWGDMIYPSLVDVVHSFEFYDDKFSLATADLIYIEAPDSVVTGIDFILGASGAISGIVHNAAPVEGAEVMAFGYGGEYYGWVPVQAPGITDAEGEYIITGLGPGDYKVRAEAEGFPTKWWDNQPDSSTADLVTVTPPDTTKNINFYLIGVEEGEESFVYRLSQNYPNPFTVSTAIYYSIAGGGHVSLSIFDVSGRLVKRLVDEDRKPGNYIVKWDGRDTEGKELASGIYFYRLNSGSIHKTKKLILVR